GELLGDHHLWRKFIAFEGSIKVPMIIRPPHSGGDVPRGSCDDRNVCLEDIMPTLLEEAGIDIPPTVEARSLSAALRGGGQDGWREYIHGEHHRPDGTWQFVTDGREKFIWQTMSGKEWFFDLRNDPQELRNRVNDPAFADRVSLWRQRLIDVLARRPEDGFVSEGRLVPGTNLAGPVRQWLLEESTN